MEYVLKYLLIILAFFAPIAPMMLLVGMVVVADTIMGRWAAARVAKKEGKDVRLEVTSRKTRLGFTAKTLVYQLVLIFSFILDGYFLGDVVLYFIPEFPIEFMVTKLVGIFLIWIEWTSINENYNKIYGITITDLFKKYIRGLKKIVMGIVNFNKEVKKISDNE